MHYFNRVLLLLLMVTGVLLVGCNIAGGPTADVTATPTPTPREISSRIGAATRATETVHFLIELTGAPVAAEPSGFFTLVTMEGDLKRPDAVLATVTVRSVTGIAEVRTVSLAGRQYVTNPITRQWQCVAADFAFDPAILFDPEVGLSHLLETGFEEVELIGIEDLEGQPHYHLRGIVPGEELRAISYNSLGAGPVAVDLWAEQSTMRAKRIILVDTATDPEQPSTWTMNFSDYGKAVDVRVPPGADC
ncbi:MAG: LppX_LprAFG lipoprotein [Chloroflexaceae bacterium]